MNQEQIQQAARDEALVPTDDNVKISLSNMRIDPTLTQKEETYQVILDIIENSLCYNAFLIIADVPEIYMQQSKLRRREIMPYPILPKIIIHYFLSKHKSISMRPSSYVNTIKDDAILGRLKFIGKGEETQEYGLAIPDTMLTKEVKNSKAYQTFLAISNGIIPLKKGRGQHAKGKREAVTPKKKSSITVDDNIIPDPDEALKLGKIKPTGVVIKDTPTVSKKKSLDQSQKLKGIQVMIEEEQLAANTKKAIKASKKAKRIQQQSTGSSEGVGITLEVPNEPKASSIAKVDAKDDWDFDNKSDKSDEHVVNEGEVGVLLTDDKEKAYDDEMQDDDKSIDIE
ncbi:hypothetical protein Tco_0905779 [Tanacetum coccineum]